MISSERDACSFRGKREQTLSLSVVPKPSFKALLVVGSVWGGVSQRCISAEAVIRHIVPARGKKTQPDLAKIVRVCHSANNTVSTQYCKQFYYFFLPPYTTTMDLNENNRDVLEVHTFVFKRFYAGPQFSRALKYLDISVNITIVSNTWIKLELYLLN